jgi:NAD(P)-dependent dehydrogenase (short-subunit alcohol dehydrogenase family)
MTQNSKIAIVTGAGSGIGKATAMALLQDGWSVVLAGRRQANLEEVVEEAKALNAGSRVLAVPTDVTQEDSVANLFAQCVQNIWPCRFVVQQCGCEYTRYSLARTEFGNVEGRGRYQFDRHVLVHPRSLSRHERPEAHGWPHHQQRLYFSHHAKAPFLLPTRPPSMRCLA